MHLPHIRMPAIFCLVTSAVPPIVAALAHELLAEWQTTLNMVVSNVACDLGCFESLEARLDRLLYFEPGSCFQALTPSVSVSESSAAALTTAKGLPCCVSMA